MFSRAANRSSLRCRVDGKLGSALESPTGQTISQEDLPMLKKVTLIWATAGLLLVGARTRCLRRRGIQAQWLR